MIYFDNGATTFPKPLSVRRAMNLAMTDYGANPGRSGHKMSVKAAEVMFACRESAARLFGLEQSENIIFTLNCTAALNTVICGTLKPGDHAVISSFEHNAVVRPLEALREKGVEYSVAECVPYDDDKTVDNFRAKFKANTRLVVCTHASNVFGIKLPVTRLAALCRLNGILFCVDAAQSAGMVEYNLKDTCIDYLCTAGHKGLYGPMGTGLLVVNSRTHPAPLVFGGTGSESANFRQPEALPDRYESGTPNLSGIAGLRAGIEFVMSRGVRNISKKEIFLATALYNSLKSTDGVVLYTRAPGEDVSVPVVSFNVRELESEKTAKILNDNFGIAVRAGLHCAPLAHKSFGTFETGTVRAVMSAFTTPAEVTYLSGAIGKICGSKRKL